MHVLFVVYTDHDNYHMRTKMFKDDDKNYAGKLAKEWLFDELNGWCFGNIHINDNEDDTTLPRGNLSKDDVHKIFKEKSFEEVARFISYYTICHVQYEHFSTDKPTEKLSMFNFMEFKSDYVYSINENLILNIKRITCAVANLYFTDNLNNKIDIPNEIKIYTFDEGIRIEQKPIDKQHYALCWTDKYDIEFNKGRLITIENQRYWNIWDGHPSVIKADLSNVTSRNMSRF